MISRRLVLTLLVTLAATPAAAQDNPTIKLPVVATFSILADLAANVGGDRVALAALVKPNTDGHVFAPSPNDAKTLAAAKLVVSNGLGFEGWMERLLKSSATKATIVVASKGVAARKLSAAGHDHGHDADPHAWQSVANAKIYVGNIRDGLIKADPAGKPVYEANASAYLARLDALDAEIRAAFATIPAERRRIITSHDAFGYFGAAYGVSFIAPQGVSTDSEASARDVARIIGQVKKQKIPAVFMENVSDARLLRRIADETGAKIGGTLYSDALTDASGPAPSYIEMMRHNATQLAAALAG